MVEDREALPGVPRRDRGLHQGPGDRGLDIVTDGQMHFDQYGGAIGSFVWYWYERLGGFSKSKLPNPIARGIEASGEDLSQAAWMHDWGGTAVTAKVSRGIPGRLGEECTRSPAGSPISR